jgi:hypothetical protein
VVFNLNNKWLTIISIFSKTRSETLIKLFGDILKCGGWWGVTIKIEGKLLIAK